MVINKNFVIDENSNIVTYTHKENNFEFFIDVVDREKVEVLANWSVNRKVDKKTGSKVQYIRAKVGDYYYLVHRHVIGLPPSLIGNKRTTIEIHHYNGDTFDNRRENLFIMDRKTHMTVHRMIEDGYKELDLLIYCEGVDAEFRKELGMISRREFLEGRNVKMSEDIIREIAEEKEMKFINGLIEEVKGFDELLRNGKNFYANDLEYLVKLSEYTYLNLVKIK